jgi:hypothetical protein
MRLEPGIANIARVPMLLPRSIEAEEPALRNSPWRHSKGSRTAAGKAQAAANGKTRQKGEQSVRALRASVADVGSLAQQLADLRNMLERNHSVGERHSS